MKNKVFTFLSWLVFYLFVFIFVTVAGYILYKGLAHFHWSFLIDSFENSGREGGILPIIVSTLYIVVTALIVSGVLSFITAISIDFLKSYKKLHSFLTLCLDTLSATPSIVFGLVGNIVFCQYLGFGYSLLSGALTLSVMILPVLTRTILIGLSNVPMSINSAMSSLNMSSFSCYFRVKLVMVKKQIITGSFIGLGRSLAETAALLFTSGYSVKMPGGLLDSGRSISIHIYELAMNVPGGNENAFKSAFTLILLVAVISLIAYVVQNTLKPENKDFVWN